MGPRRICKSAPPEEAELKSNVDVLLRRLASFYTRYAQEVITQRRAISDGELSVQPYREMVTASRLGNADLSRQFRALSEGCLIFSMA